MTLPVVLSPIADREFEEAATWFQRHAGRGEQFVAQVQIALDRIGQAPEHHAPVHRDVRRVRVQRFPYNVYFRVLMDRIEVIAVFHQKRNPAIWRSRA